MLSAKSKYADKNVILSKVTGDLTSTSQSLELVTMVIVINAVIGGLSGEDLK